MAAGLRPPSWVFENLKDAGYGSLVSEVVHQISERSVKRIKSYHNYKNPRWRPAYGRDLGFFEKYRAVVLAFVGPKWYTKFQKDWSNGLKVIVITKLQDGRRPAAAILDF
jgi:hypothetical protein